ncbi:MAG TPA: hypothetical protein VGM30_10405 [Puia sp.]|jgi:hypothetical protein
MPQDRNILLVEETVKLVDERNKESLTKIKLTLNRVFGEANNQIIRENLVSQLQQGSPYREEFSAYFASVVKKLIRYKVILYFPELIIANAQGNSHVIKDIYVSFHLTTTLRLHGDLQGMRTTFSKNEWVSEYTHSHLNDRCTKFSNFCTGTGPINDVTNALREEYDEINFEMFCYQIQSYLAYESIEGTPYEYISNIGTDTIVVALDDQYLPQLSYIYTHFLNTHSIDDIRSHLRIVVSKRIDVDPTDNFEKELAKYLKRLKGMASSANGPLRNVPLTHLFAYKTSDGKYTNITSETSITYTPEVLITFKGEKKKLSIINPPEIEDKNLYYANPSITRYICSRLSRELTKASFAFKGIKTEGVYSVESPVTESNSLPMLKSA